MLLKASRENPLGNRPWKSVVQKKGVVHGIFLNFIEDGDIIWWYKNFLNWQK